MSGPPIQAYAIRDMARGVSDPTTWPENSATPYLSAGLPAQISPRGGFRLGAPARAQCTARGRAGHDAVGASPATPSFRTQACHSVWSVALLERLGARKAAFFFVAREGVAYHGSRELVALLARHLHPGGFDQDVPDAVPFWQGSYLPHEVAFERWAIPDVWAVIIGCRDAQLRRQLVALVRKQPPFGLFDVDADADRLKLSLPLHGFVLPQCAIRLSEYGRAMDRETGLDVIGFSSEDEQILFELEALVGVFEGRDLVATSLLRMLSRGAGRPLPDVRPVEGFDALVDHAFELYWLGAVGGAGTVAGVAFELLMQSALSGPDEIWLQAQGAAGNQIKLNDVIAKVASAGGWDARRLHDFRHLRNDLAHRLGDDAFSPRDEGELKDLVYRFLLWLALQRVDDAGHAVLKDVPPDPELTYQQLLDEAQSVALEAARGAETTQLRLAGQVVAPFGVAWVIVRDQSLPFTKWLLDNNHALAVAAGARVSAPDTALHRNLAWAHAFATRLRRSGHIADFAGTAT